MCFSFDEGMNSGLLAIDGSLSKHFELRRVFFSKIEILLNVNKILPSLQLYYFLIRQTFVKF